MGDFTCSRRARSQLVARLDPSHAFFDLVARGVDPPSVLRRAEQECLQPLLTDFVRTRVRQLALCPSCIGAGRWWARTSELGVFELEPLLHACEREEEEHTEEKTGMEEKEESAQRPDGTDMGTQRGAGVSAADARCERCQRHVTPRAALGGLRREFLLADGGSKRQGALMLVTAAVCLGRNLCMRMYTFVSGELACLGNGGQVQNNRSSSVAHLCRSVGVLARVAGDIQPLTIFLSHRGPDTKEQMVRPLHFVLERLGVSAFFDQARPGALLACMICPNGIGG